MLGESSRSVWRGIIRVDKGAQSTDAFQENRNLLLSPHAHADSIPGLEIHANDVRCTHGATVGRVDLRALLPDEPRARAPRGRAADRARLLPAALERIGSDEVRETLAAAIDQRLPAG